MELRYYLIYLLTVTFSTTCDETDTTETSSLREKRHSNKHYPAVKYSQPDPFLQKSIELGNTTNRKDISAESSNVYNHFAPAQWKLKNPSSLYRGGPPSGIRQAIRPPPNTVRQVSAAFVRNQPPPRPPHQLFQPPPPEQQTQQSYSPPQPQPAYAAPQQPQTSYASPQPSYTAPQPTAHGHLLPPHIPPSSPPQSYSHPPPSYGPPSHQPYVDNEPIIEIIIKESNETLPPPPPIIIPTTPKPAKEPIQVFYVKYKKKPAADNSGKEEIEYEEPIPALTPLPVEHEETPVTEGYAPHVPAVEYPVARQPSTTLRTIIKPDSEAYHSTGGLKVTFGETIKSDGGPTYAKRDSKKLRTNENDDDEDDTAKKDSVGGHSEIRSNIFPFTNPDREFTNVPNALREIPPPEFNRIGRKQGSEFLNNAPSGAASSIRFREPLFVEDGSVEGPPAPTFDSLRENPAQSFAALRQNRPPSYETSGPNSLPSFEGIRHNPVPSFEPSRQNTSPNFETLRQNPSPSFEPSRQKPAPSFESLRQLQNQLNQAPQRPKFNPTLETPQSNIVAFPGPTDARTIADLKAQREEHEKLQYKIQQQYLNLDQSEPKPTQPQYLIHPQKAQSLGLRLNPQQQRLYQQQLFELVQKEQQILQQKQIEQAFQKAQNQHRFQATEQSQFKTQESPPNFNKILSPEQFRLNEAIFNQPKIVATQRQPENIPSNNSPALPQPKFPINVKQQQPDSPLSFEEQVRLYQQFTQLQPNQQNNVLPQQQSNQSPQPSTQQLSNEKLQQLLQEYYRNQQLQQYFNQRGKISQNSEPDLKPELATQQIFESSQQNKFASSPSKENAENSQNSDSQIYKSISTIENHEIYKNPNLKVNQQKEPTINQEQDVSPLRISQNNDARNENDDRPNQAQKELIYQYQINARKEQEKQYEAQRNSEQKAQKEELEYQARQLAAQRAQNDELAYQAQKKAALKAYNDELAYQAQKAKADELAYQSRIKAAEKAQNEELAYQAQKNAEQKAKADELAYQARIKAAQKAQDEELAYQTQIKNAQKAYQEELANRQREEQFQKLSKVSPTPTQSSSENTRKNPAADKAKIKAKLESLPEEVPDDVRQQLLSSGILSNADIQILDYDKVGDIPIENLPPEALEQLKGSHSEPVPAVLTSNNNKTTMKVVRYNSNTEEGQKVQKSYTQADATLVDPVVLNDTNYNRYLPLKVAGAQFPIPDSPLLRGKNITSVVILAPVEYNFAGSENRTAKVVAQVEDIKFVAGDLIKNVVKRPSRRNFERWLEKEKVSSPSKQSVIMLVANAKDNNVKNEIFMYDIGTEDISKLEGQLSSAFVEVAETNATEDLVSNISAEEETNEITTAIPFYGISDQRKKKPNRRNANKIA